MKISCKDDENNENSGQIRDIFVVDVPFRIGSSLDVDTVLGCAVESARALTGDRLHGKQDCRFVAAVLPSWNIT